MHQTSFKYVAQKEMFSVKNQSEIQIKIKNTPQLQFILHRNNTATHFFLLQKKSWNYDTVN